MSGGSTSGEPSATPPSSLVLPLIMWSSKPPKLKITCLQFLRQGEHIVAGSENGSILLWRCADDGVYPSLLMTGHASAVTALCSASLSPKSTRFVSACMDGDMCVWDWMDGRCIDSAPGTLVHTRMLPFWKRSGHLKCSIIVCSGEYNDLFVMDANDLTTLFCFYSRVEPDWCSAFTFIFRSDKPDMCIGLTMSGMVKLWRLADLDKKDMNNPVYEDESKRLVVSQVKDVVYDCSNQSLLLLVSQNAFHLVDLDDLSVVLSVPMEVNVCSARVIDVDKVCIACNDSTLRVFQLPITLLRGSSAEARFGPISSRRNFLDSSKPVEFARLDAPVKPCYQEWLGACEWSFLYHSSSQWISARMDCEGSLLIWRLPKYEEDLMKKLTNMPQQLPMRYKGTHCSSLDELWKNLEYTDEDNFPNLGDEHVTVSLYLPSQGRMLMGMRDGYIVTRYICELISSRFLAESNSQWRNSTRAMRAHRSAVRSLIHPASVHPRFDSNLVLSGGDDFAVCLWHVGTATRLHRFCVNGGPVTRFLVPPENASKSVVKCVVAVGEDASVALLNVRDFKCLLLATRHPSPVVSIRFRTLDDYILVKLKDGDVYVWQLETGSIDRIASGMTAEDMMTAVDEAVGAKEVTDQSGATSAIQLVRALRHGQLDVMKKMGGGKEGDATESVQSTVSTLPSPLSVYPLFGSTGAHVVLLDIAALIAALNVLDTAEEQIDDISIGNRDIRLSTDESGASALSSRLSMQFESTLLHDIARIVLSLLHAWNLDDDLDRVCSKKLLLQHMTNIPTFANISRLGQLCIFMPSPESVNPSSWCVNTRWQYASSLTTVHLLAIISLLNSLMALKGLSWNRTKRTTASIVKKEKEKEDTDKKSQCSWSVAIAFHLVLLPNALKQKGAGYAAPRLELLARRWQDSCFEIRQAAQALLVRELSRIESTGRRRLIESWAPFLPPLLDGSISIFGPRPTTTSPSNAANSIIAAPPIPPRNKKGDMPSLPPPRIPEKEDGEECGVREVRRNQATAVVLLAVVGGEFGDELFKADLTRVTALCLLDLLICPSSPLLPSHSPLRRAAIDLLGRGFPQWEPHLEISKVILGLLSLASQSPSTGSSSLRLSPTADAQRTARHALSLIAKARAPALLAALSMEVARYNSAAQHQTIQHTVQSPLLKSRYEVLRLVDELSCTNYADVVDMMLPVGDLLVHCLDASLLKHRSLTDIFPPITKFSMVAYCSSTRRIAFGGKNGNCVVHDLRASKAQTLHAHGCAVSALAFSEDGKMLASYGGEEGKINLWQTTQSFLGMGQSSLKCIKAQAAPVLDRVTEMSKPRLVWINSKALTLMLPDGREQRFAV